MGAILTYAAAFLASGLAVTLGWLLTAAMLAPVVMLVQWLMRRRGL